MIDAYASIHARHLLGIFQALPQRGAFSADGPAADYLTARGIPLAPLRGTGPVLVANHADSLRVRGRPIILVEHGAGQDYGGRNPANPGGTDREHIALFLCTNESVAARNRAAYPNTPSVVIGAPCIPVRSRPAGRTVAIAFHWNCKLAPESGWAFDHFARVLPALAERFDLIGHGHPRVMPRLQRIYRNLGIEAVPDLDDVLERASVFVCDNSSALFEAAISRPVVLMDSPTWRKDVHHGLRFWEWADIGPRTSNPDALGDLIEQALDRDDFAQVRGTMAASVYPMIGADATRAAVAAIEEFMLTERAQTGNRAGRVEPPGRLPMTALQAAGVSPRDIGQLRHAWAQLGRSDRMKRATVMAEADYPTVRQMVDVLLKRQAPTDLGPLPDPTGPLTPAPLVSQVPADDPVEWAGFDAPKARAALEVERKGPRRPEVLEELGRRIVGRH